MFRFNNDYNRGAHPEILKALAQNNEESYPGYTLQYVTFKDAPTYGSLYYNYYGTSSYGSSSSLRITDDNCDDIDFYFSPSSSQHALSELTYIPSGVNYCAQLTAPAAVLCPAPSSSA